MKQIFDTCAYVMCTCVQCPCVRVCNVRVYVYVYSVGYNTTPLQVEMCGNRCEKIMTTVSFVLFVSMLKNGKN